MFESEFFMNLFFFIILIGIALQNQKLREEMEYMQSVLEDFRNEIQEKSGWWPEETFEDYISELEEEKNKKNSR